MKKKEMRAECQRMLRTEGPLSGLDLAFMRALLWRHPDREEKVGSGVAGIRVGPSGYFGARAQYRNCFHVECTDGTSVGFSYRECISPSTPRTNLSAAMRNAIAEDMQRIGGGSGREVHHVIPFRKIAEEWLKGAGDVPLDDSGVSVTMADDAQRDDWVTFHNTHAILVSLDAEDHKAVTRADRAECGRLLSPLETPDPQNNRTDRTVRTTHPI